MLLPLIFILALSQAPLLFGPLAAPLGIVPQVALADDATVATCDEASFIAALNTVQSSGGGTISISCSGTITFTSQKTITSNVTIIGNGGVIFDGGGSTRLFGVRSAASLELIGLTIQNGNSSGQGGAILNQDQGTLTITASTVSGNNSSAQAGAIRNLGTLRITASTFSGNSTSNPDPGFDIGGAIINTGDLTVTASTFTGNTSTFSGAIANDGGILTVIASTFSSNSTSSDGGAIHNFGSGTLDVIDSTFSNNHSDGSGGAIFNGGTIGATITGSTFSGNTADGNGGAIRSSAPLSITASTITGSSAASAASAIRSDGTTTIQSTIIAGNEFTDDCVTVGSGTVSSQGSNLSDESSCNFTATGDIQNSLSVNLGALADNGGPTQTILPQAGSAAIDAANCTLSTTEDQRGVARPQGARCDIGAVETGGTVPVQIFAVYNGSGPIDEGGSATINAIAYGPAEAALDYDFDCDNAGSYETQGTGGGSSGTAACTFNDDGAFTVGMKVCDVGDGSNCDSDTTIVTVTNVAPTVDAGGNQSANEGDTVSLEPAGFTDPGTADIHTATINWGDGSPDETGTVTETNGSGTVSGSHVYVANGVYTVEVCVEDDEQEVDCDDLEVTVGNVAPAVEPPLVNPSPSDEGQSVTASASFSDPGTLDIHTCTVDYGDGPQDGTVDQDANTCTGPAHTYLDDDPSGTASDDYTVTVVVTDDDGGSGSNSATHTVNNVAPQITDVSNNGPVAEGSPATITVTASDVGTADTLSYEFDCGDDGTFEIGPQAANSASCTFSGNGSFPVPVRVTDDDTGTHTASTTVLVNNVAPTVDSPTVDIEPSNEGQSVVASASFSDPGSNDSHSCTVDYGDGSAVETGTIDGTTCTGPSHTYVDGDNTYSVTIAVCDNAAECGSNSVSHTVNNVAPSIDQIIVPAVVDHASWVSVSINASDPGGANDPLTYAFDCDGDGSYERDAGSSNSTTCRPDPTTLSPTIGVQVTDDDLGVTTGVVELYVEKFYCANTFSRSLRDSTSCMASEFAVVLRPDQLSHFCANPYTGALMYGDASCNANWMALPVPAIQPISICESRYTGLLSYRNGRACASSEVARIIPAR